MTRPDASLSAPDVLRVRVRVDVASAKDRRDGGERLRALSGGRICLGALAQLSHLSHDNQAAVARTGAIAPLCTLVREGTDEVRVQSAAALWALTGGTDARADGITVAQSDHPSAERLTASDTVPDPSNACAVAQSDRDRNSDGILASALARDGC